MTKKLPTDLLIEEHNSIKVMLKIVEKVCDNLEAGMDTDASHIQNIIEFIKVFADKCHHGKEEDILFRVMVESGFPKEGGPIAVMLAEHTIGRTYVKGMSDAFDRFQQGQQEANTAFIENARNYVSLLAQHIHKEDNILYPMANRQLSEEIQDVLRKEFEIADKENIGFDKLEELHQILNHLKGIYLD